MPESKERKYFKVLKSPQGDIESYGSIVEYDRKNEMCNGAYVDLKLLKRIILWIQSEDPEAYSLRITSVNTNSLPFLLLETKKQDSDKERKTSYVMSSLTTHVDRADKFADITMDEFMKPEREREKNDANSNDWGGVVRELTTSTNNKPSHNKPGHKESKTDFSMVEISGKPGITVAGSAGDKPKIKRTRKKKTEE